MLNKKIFLVSCLLFFSFMNMNLILSLEDYYNISYGPGIEGFINYGNILIDGWLVIAFLAFIWIAILASLTKSGWDGAISIAFASFVCLLSSIMFALFTTVSSYIIFLFAISLAGSVAWAVAKGRG